MEVVRNAQGMVMLFLMEDAAQRGNWLQRFLMLWDNPRVVLVALESEFDRVQRSISNKFHVERVVSIPTLREFAAVIDRAFSDEDHQSFQFLSVVTKNVGKEDKFALVASKTNLLAHLSKSIDLSFHLYYDDPASLEFTYHKNDKVKALFRRLERHLVQPWSEKTVRLMREGMARDLEAEGPCAGFDQLSIAGKRARTDVERQPVGATEPGGEVEATELGGEVDTTAPGGEVEATELGGEVDTTAPGSEVEATEPGSEVEATEPGREVEATEPGGEVEATEPGEVDTSEHDGEVEHDGSMITEHDGFDTTEQDASMTIEHDEPMTAEPNVHDDRLDLSTSDEEIIPLKKRSRPSRRRKVVKDLSDVPYPLLTEFDFEDTIDKKYFRFVQIHNRAYSDLQDITFEKGVPVVVPLRDDLVTMPHYKWRASDGKIAHIPVRVRSNLNAQYRFGNKNLLVRRSKAFETDVETISDVKVRVELKDIKYDVAREVLLLCRCCECGDFDTKDDGWINCSDCGDIWAHDTCAKDPSGYVPPDWGALDFFCPACTKKQSN